MPVVSSTAIFLVITELLKILTVSSLAIFAGLRDFLEEVNQSHEAFPGMEAMINAYNTATQRIYDTYSVRLPFHRMSIS